MLDLVLASGHHLAVFVLFGILFAQASILRPAIDAAAMRRVVALDMAYGLTAALVLAFGFARATLAAKGWDYYAANAAFWAKIGVFALIGLISLFPTIAFRRWRRAKAGPGLAEVLRVRRYVLAEIALFALLPILAAAMARGFGSL